MSVSEAHAWLQDFCFTFKIMVHVTKLEDIFLSFLCTKSKPHDIVKKIRNEKAFLESTLLYSQAPLEQKAISTCIIITYPNNKRIIWIPSIKNLILINYLLKNLKKLREQTQINKEHFLNLGLCSNASVFLVFFPSYWPILYFFLGNFLIVQ